MKGQREILQHNECFVLSSGIKVIISFYTLLIVYNLQNQKGTMTIIISSP